MFEKNVIILLQKLKRRRDLQYFQEFKNGYLLEKNILEEYQIKYFKELFDIVKREIPYYDELFSKLRLNKDDFNFIKDLEKIPILTKQDILSNKDKFIARRNLGRYFWNSTGGSTGEPLKYKLDVKCYSMGVGLLYRGWSHAGYDVGNKLAVIAGGSLVKNNSSYLNKLNQKLLRINSFSSYGISEESFHEYYSEIDNWKPKYLRGYASSLALFSSFMIKNKLELKHKIKGVFSTAEMLSLSQRNIIESCFKTKVYNQYGLNDGGVSAYEDYLDEGFAIDTERSILEVVDDEGQQVYNKTGNIIATALFNFNSPFIRYSTGDTGQVEQWKLDNKILRPRLTNLGGRITDSLTINDKAIGSPVLTTLMSKVNAFRYQIVQKSNTEILIVIDNNNLYDKQKEEEFIRKSLFSNLGEFNISFDYSGNFIKSDNKHKFIINLND